jgi:DNA-binding response OmpR family regulator
MRKKIAIIDDEREILIVLERFLSRSEKFDIEVFIDPIMGFNAVKLGSYDLILLDIMMPKISGINILEDIKKIQQDIKVIMMTAYSTIDKVIDSNKLGADDYVTKPFVSLRDIENKILDNLGL